MYATEDQRRIAAEMLARGRYTDGEIAREAGLSRRTINRWKNHGFSELPLCLRRSDLENWRPAEPSIYLYLLGLYLGDGLVSLVGASGSQLRITLDDKYPGIVEGCAEAIDAISGRPPYRYQRCDDHGVNLFSYSPIWPYAFPQHGPGRKHMRKIELVPWQEEMIDPDPRPLLRGLIHSDGCRCLNRFSVELKDGPREYEYPRYFFTNYSADIRGIFCHYCEAMGIRWSQSSFKNISVAHRESVAMLDSFIGPKV